MDQPMLIEVIKLLLIYGSIGRDAGSGWMFIVRFVVVMHCCSVRIRVFSLCHKVTCSWMHIFFCRKMKDTSLQPRATIRHPRSEHRAIRTKQEDVDDTRSTSSTYLLMNPSTILQISRIGEICFIIAVVIFFVQIIRIFSVFSLKDLGEL